MPNYAIMRLEKRKLGAVTRICNHHERLKPVYKSNPDIDPARSHLNYHLIEPAKGYRQLVLERIKQAGAKQRKDSVVMEDCLITATPDWIRSKSDAQQKAFFDYAYLFFEQHFRRENIISAVVHLDEATPHMHLCFVPITEDNRLSAKDINKGPAGMKEWQDKFHAHIVQQYPDIDRGKPKRETHRQHIPTYLFKLANGLYAHYDELCAAINSIGMVGNAKKKEEAIALLGRFAPEMAQLKVQMEATDKHIQKLEASIKEGDAICKDLFSENVKQADAIKAANESLYQLHEKQTLLDRVISLLPDGMLEELAAQEKNNRKLMKKGAATHMERVQMIQLSDLKPFPDNPFRLVENEELEALTESVKEYGLFSPIITRPLETGGYEVIAGQRRIEACRKAGIAEIPAFIRPMDRDAAVIALVDSNIHRENILPSERAFSYKLKLEALKHQGKRTDLSLEQVAPKLSTELIGEEHGTSKDTVKRYIRLTCLIPEILQKVDDKEIAISPAVAISFLSQDEQVRLLHAMEEYDCTPSHAQALRLKEMSQQEALTPAMLNKVMAQPKPNQQEYIKIPMEGIRKYFPRGFSESQMVQQLVKLLEQHFRKQQNRDNR